MTYGSEMQMKEVKGSNMKKRIVTFSLDHPVLIVALTSALVALCVGAGVLRAALKNWDIVDTDPENMLAPTEEVRVFHNDTKKEFTLHDMVIVGIANEADPDGVFNPATLSKILKLTEFIKGIEGVISPDIIAPSEVDNIEQAGPGTLRFERLMESAPADREGALRVRENAKNHPMLFGTLLSEDAKALCLYIPIEEKNLSHEVSVEIRSEAKSLGMAEMSFSNLGGGKDGLSPKGDVFGITGLPVAEDTFGVEMFKQMAISAPLAMLIIFILMLIFFRKFVLVLSPMIVAMVSVLCTMGLLIGFGFPVHIMSSMIPIFLMPIAVVDSVHILSEFFDRYRKFHDTRKTVTAIMDELFTPMLYTSLTSAAGFASLSLTPIPPVQVFGLLVAFGIMLAWILTVTLIPAYTMFIPKPSLEKFGAAHGDGVERSTLLTRLLHALGRFTVTRSRTILVVTMIVIALSAIGIALIRVNDNPTKWFVTKHPIRVADRVLNSHFGGTYMAYLVLKPKKPLRPDAGGLAGQLAGFVEAYTEAEPAINEGRRQEIAGEIRLAVTRSARGKSTRAKLVNAVDEWVLDQLDAAGEDEYPLWDAIATELSNERARADVFKRPEMLRYMGKLEEAIKESGLVGKTNSVATLVKHIHRELKSGESADFTIPVTAPMVAECYIQAQSGHDPEDLWHLVTPDYTRANVWVQLRSGDNLDMERVTVAVDRFLEKNPPPVPLSHRWAGLTYVNVVWQDKMVSGMVRSLLGSFAIVFLMMVFLFRSFLWGLLCMVPLSVTIAFIYGLIGFAGKDYDMPVAILSSLTLGLSVDFSIHYLQRAREIFAKVKNWKDTAAVMSGEPMASWTQEVEAVSSVSSVCMWLRTAVRILRR